MALLGREAALPPRRHRFAPQLLHGPFQVVVRTVLLCLFLPAMVWDKDGRSLHDKAAGTLIVRT